MFDSLQSSVQELKTPVVQQKPVSEITTKAPGDPLPVMQPQTNSVKAENDEAVSQPETETGSKKVEEMENVSFKEATVTINKVDSPTTPAAMNTQRIPPGKTTYAKVNVSGIKEKKPSPVIFKINNNGGGNGKVDFDPGGASYSVNKNGTFDIPLKGTYRTGVGNGGKLKLTATQLNKESEEKELQTSNGFSVSAIPQNWVAKQPEGCVYVGNRRGVCTEEYVNSDSDVRDDLNGVEVKERIDIFSQDGYFEKDKREDIVTQTAQIFGSERFSDRHVTTINGKVTPGKIVIHQTHSFVDNRSGSNEVAVTNSGYIITKDITKRSEEERNKDVTYGGLQLRSIVTKVGGKATAEGYSSDPGSVDGVIIQDQLTYE